MSDYNNDYIMLAENIKKGYQSGDSIFWALGGISVAVPRGKLTLLRGRSGSGKTTLMNIMGGLDSPTEGKVFFDDKEVTKATEKERDQIRRKNMGFVFQSVALVSMMTAYENVEFAMRVAGCPADGRRKRSEECLKMVGLGPRMKHLPQELSGGEQQRVAIARAIAHRPAVIFADEPTAELDTTTGLQVIKIFRELVDNENISVVLTTHDQSLMSVADVVYELEDGVLTNG